jgi:hypothetical protein
LKKFLLILFLSPCALVAQGDILSSKDSLSYNVFKETVPFWRMEKNLKFSPFDIFSAVSTIGADLETVMKPGLSFQYGAAFIPSFLQFTVGNSFQQFNWMNGYRLRFESRFSGFKNESFYVSTEFSFRHLIIGDELSVGMEGDGEGNFAYFMNDNITVNRFSSHFNVKFGFQLLSKANVVVDWFGGMSFRFNNVIASQATIPEGGVIVPNWNRFDWELTDGHNFGYAMPIIGMRVGIHWPAKPDIY